MKTIKSLSVLGCTLLALGSLCVTAKPAKADVPFLEGYQFTCDVRSDVLDSANYQIFNGLVKFVKSHTPFFKITKQNPDGTFTGSIWYTNNGLPYPIKGQMTQSFTESMAGTFSMTFQQNPKGNIYDLHARLEFSGAVFVAGGYQYRPVESNVRLQFRGPAPITGVGFLPGGIVK